MKTPDTKAGRITERIMTQVRKRFPNMDTNTYNGIYSAALSELSLELPESSAVVFPGGGGMMINRKPFFK